MNRRPAPCSLLLAGPMLALAGCATGPDYTAPQPQVAAAWVGPADAGPALSARWWQALGDPLLDTLVGEMLVTSPDLREAQARLAEARAGRDAVRGGGLPQVGAGASGNHVVLSENGQIPVGQVPGFARAFDLFDVGFDASWEMDLWGRQARQRDAAEARAQAAALALEAARLQLAAELARAYVLLRLAQSEAATAEAMLAARTDLARLTALRAAGGETNAIESHRANAEQVAAQAALAQAQATVREAAVRIAVLTGASPAAMIVRLEAPGAIPAPPVAIGAGLPADLLRRRPDIRQAERLLAAATADIGVARADLYPRLTLGLTLGQQARTIGDLADGGSTRMQVGPGLAWPLFSGGRVRALVRAADARADAASARYDAAVVGALADSEGAISRFERSLAALDSAGRAEAHERAAQALAERRVEAGEDDRLASARARLAALDAIQRHRRARAAASEAAIALCKALGGGWDASSMAVATVDR